MVSELLIPGCQSWDYELLLEYFTSRDVQEILKITLPSTLRHDRIIWHQTNDGVYSVKSAYKILMAELEQHRTANNIEKWKELWKFKAPAKFKTLLWQAFRNCLPTRTNLSRRGINCPLVCVICTRDMENTWHIFVSCPYAAQCWTISNMKDIVDQCAKNADRFVDWFFKVLMAGDKVNVGGKENNAIGRTPTEWRKPQYQFLKCNVDATFFTETRSMRFGMVVRDTEGKCIGCRSMVMEGLYEVKEGEAMGLCEALSWIREMNFNQVIFGMDAQIIVKAILPLKS
ncbi:uncharacterized protein LOC142504911 [Primulina tabacum]|uniref:uncharacterized protein LOC142504911 n=1 Tax=Primulina tabacum TaxID=48773 RepID=UPI003F594C0A